MSRKKYAKGHKRRVEKRHSALLTPDKSTYVRRTHKDKLFRFIFRDRKKLLQLYNVLNGSDYQDEGELRILTLEARNSADRCGNILALSIISGKI